MAKKRGLGRSLDALLGGASSQHEKSARAPAESTPAISGQDQPQEAESEGFAKTKPTTPKPNVIRAASESAATSENAAVDTLQELPLERIRRGTYQPRQNFDKESLQELADSVKSEGLIQPILVRPFADGYELIAGERRWRAAQLAGLQKIPAIVRKLTDQSVAAVALIENIQRKDLNPMEEARALHRLQTEFDMTHQAVAEAVGRSRAAVSNLMRLLDLHEEVKVMVDQGDLDMGHARALLAAEKQHQLALAKEITKKGLSVRATERLLKSGKSENGSTPTKSKRDPNIVALEKKLGDTLGAGVSIRHQPNGKGKLEINYSSLDELDGILKHIK